MTLRRSPIGLLLGAILTASVALAAPADSSAKLGAASAPAATDARIKLALSDAVRLHVGAAGLDARLRGYIISPALIQLRRYVETGQKQLKTVCVVELGLKEDQGNLVASVRGNAATLGASPLEAVDAAARSAVSRMPEVLAALQGPRPSDGQLATR